MRGRQDPAPLLLLALAAGFLAGCASGTQRTTGSTARTDAGHLATTPVVVGGAGADSTATPKKLIRRLHFPAANAATCPQSPGRFVQTATFAAMTVGSGPVRIALDDAGNPHQGFHPAAGLHGWLDLKTHVVRTPAYDGPILVRAERLDRPGPTRFGATPAATGPLLVLGSIRNGGRPVGGRGGWVDIPYFTFVRAPGCYGWQIDGLTFSTTVVVRVLTRYHP